MPEGLGYNELGKSATIGVFLSCGIVVLKRTGFEHCVKASGSGYNCPALFKNILNSPHLQVVLADSLNFTLKGVAVPP